VLAADYLEELAETIREVLLVAKGERLCSKGAFTELLEEWQVEFAD
jgi:hypothetical protein